MVQLIARRQLIRCLSSSPALSLSSLPLAEHVLSSVAELGNAAFEAMHHLRTEQSSPFDKLRDQWRDWWLLTPSSNSSPGWQAQP
jgi:hypothetical protein